MVSFSALFAVAASITGVVKAHSWIHCSDYRGDRRNYEPAQCFGHPRPVNGLVPQQSSGFGVDTGFNEQPTTSCNTDHAENSEAYPMARYKQGQEIVLAWPSKNHVAAPCTNPFIPDTSLELFVAPLDLDGHPDEFVQVQASFSDDPHVDKTIDFKGFQNCPAFCENMDKSLCTGTFTVPTDLADGVYTFQWKWVFNKGTAPYITCFEAYVGQDVAPVPQPTPSPTREGMTPAPTVESTQDNCTLGMWAQCAGGSMGAGSCCAGGVPCQKQSEFYSQCRTDCPQGWECDNGPAPVTAPTMEPTEPVATQEPSASPTPSPTAAPSACPETANVDTCPIGFGLEGALRKAKGQSAFTASLPSPCGCAHFCRLFNPSASHWRYKQSNQDCACFTSAKGVKGKDGAGVWVGEIGDVANVTV